MADVDVLVSACTNLDITQPVKHFLLLIVLQLRQKAKKQKHRFSGEMQKVQVK